MWLGREEISIIISSEVHKYSLGQGVEVGGGGVSRGQEVVKNLAKESFSSWAFALSVEQVEEFTSSAGTELVFLRRDPTYDQNLRGVDFETDWKKLVL